VNPLASERRDQTLKSGDFVNKGLSKGLREVLARKEREESQRLAERVKLEEKVSLAQQDKMRLLQEVRALEGRPIYYRTGPNADEQRLDCKRVGKGFLLVSLNGQEPYKIKRSSEEKIRTPEERLLGILDEKVNVAEKTLQANMTRAVQKLDNAAADLMKEFEAAYKKIENVRRFRGRVFDTLSKRGFILNTKRR
jgi:hypothetical protein